MIGFDDHIRLTKALDEAARLRTRVKKLESQLALQVERYERLESAAKVINKSSIRAQIITLMEQGYRNYEIIRMGFNPSTVENTRRLLRDANNGQ